MSSNPDDIFIELFEFLPRKGDLKKIEIIKATINCLAYHGVENTTYEAIATSIGTRKAHIAYHFSDKNLLFLACIKYILATYQKLSVEKLKDSQSGMDMLKHFVEGPFLWAKKHPEQLTVMLLLYYYAHMNEDYRELHTQVREGGYNRVNYILTQKLKFKSNAEKTKFISFAILNTISGQLLSVTSADKASLENAMKDTWRTVKVLTTA